VIQTSIPSHPPWPGPARVLRSWFFEIAPLTEDPKIHQMPGLTAGCTPLYFSLSRTKARDGLQYTGHAPGHSPPTDRAPPTSSATKCLSGRLATPQRYWPTGRNYFTAEGLRFHLTLPVNNRTPKPPPPRPTPPPPPHNPHNAPPPPPRPRPANPHSRPRTAPHRTADRTGTSAGSRTPTVPSAGHDIEIPGPPSAYDPRNDTL